MGAAGAGAAARAGVRLPRDCRAAVTPHKNRSVTGKKNKPAFAGLSEEQLCDSTADGGEDEGRQNDRRGSAAALLFAEEHDIAEACAGRQTGDQRAEADRAADIKLAQKHAHRAARHQSEHCAQQRLKNAAAEQDRGEPVLARLPSQHEIQREQHREQEERGA